MGIFSKAQGTNIDDNAQIQSNEHQGYIQICTPPLSFHHSVALGGLPLVGVLDAPSAKMCGKYNIVI